MEKINCYCSKGGKLIVIVLNGKINCYCYAGEVRELARLSCS